MKYIKSISAIAITVSVAGFVVWHLMWMTGIEKKLYEERSSGVVNKTEIKERISEGRKGKTEKNRPAAEAEPVFVKESGTRISQPGTPRQQTVTQGGSKSDGAEKQAAEETKTETVKEAGRWSGQDAGLGRNQQDVSPAPGKTRTEIPNDKTMSVTNKNKANPVIQKNITRQQPMQRPDVKVPGVAPSPTSTAPQ